MSLRARRRRASAFGRPRRGAHSERSANGATSRLSLRLDELAENRDVLVLLANAVGNPLTLLVAILPKVSRRCGGAAEQALATLTEVDLHPFHERLTYAAVAAIAVGCPRITSLNLYGCERITDAAVAPWRGMPADHIAQPVRLRADHRRGGGGRGSQLPTPPASPPGAEQPARGEGREGGILTAANSYFTCGRARYSRVGVVVGAGFRRVVWRVCVMCMLFDYVVGLCHVCLRRTTQHS